ncbi:hypothetical protein ACTACM_20305 [Pseudomonas fragariae (ex Marin et al. 2024)]|uniref:Uncharacterized protein n=1 Tax=Pseudomonas syringae UB303 TaxID=1357287 RepID=A0AAJ4B428_PSESX|nr:MULTISPECIES: hypothetical protein [Pseudomonas]MCA5970060.1 hypothetical protein [Pseudomonas sp. P129]MCH5536148.1 hypothetical protein [Pseudomonas syringae pv. syringae]MCH5572236.1 hypothetical protein [Pseudomonas syringae pv. syringae]MEE1993171.1 hypothetical protein [Pseudomonas syringae pv. syringae]MEE1999413.1 hypothetical protein [Pseudomonas syringae pv. syringae]
MNSKDIIKKVDFKSFFNSNSCDPITSELIKKSRISDTVFPIPPEISAYDDQNKNTLKSIIEFRAKNLASQGRLLNGADLCAASLEASKDKALRSWIPLEIENFLVIFIINSESFEIDGCMSLKIKD